MVKQKRAQRVYAPEGSKAGEKLKKTVNKQNFLCTEDQECDTQAVALARKSLFEAYNQLQV